MPSADEVIAQFTEHEIVGMLKAEFYGVQVFRIRGLDDLVMVVGGEATLRACYPNAVPLWQYRPANWLWKLRHRWAPRDEDCRDKGGTAADLRGLWCFYGNCDEA